MDKIIKHLVDRCREKFDYYDIVDECSEMVDYGSIIEFLFTEITGGVIISKMETVATDNNVGSNWIPVTERLPEQDAPVLGMYKRNPFAEFEPTIVEWIGNGWINTTNDQYGTVTHWMSLPETPKEGQ